MRSRNCDSGNHEIQETENTRFRKLRTRDPGGVGGGVGGDDDVHVRVLQFESAGFRLRVLQFPESAGFANPGFPNAFSFRIRTLKFPESPVPESAFSSFVS